MEGALEESVLLGAAGLLADYVPMFPVRSCESTYAAVSPHDGTMDSLILPLVSEQAMSLFLREVS